MLVAGGTSPECTSGVPFSVGRVEDEDLDQNVQERWISDYTPTVPDLGVTLTLQPIPSQPATRVDPSPAYLVPVSAFAVGVPHTVDVFISDGFDNSGSRDGGAVKPTDTLPDRYYVRHTWTVLLQEPCTAGGSTP